MLCSLFQSQTFFLFCLLLGAPNHAQLKVEIKKKRWDCRKHLNFRIPLVERETVHGREITYLIVIGSAVVHFAQVIRVLYNSRQLESRYHCTFTHCHISHHHLDSA